MAALPRPAPRTDQTLWATAGDGLGAGHLTPFIQFLRLVLPDNPSKHREYFPWTFPNQLLKKSNLTALALCTNTVRASAGD